MENCNPFVGTSLKFLKINTHFPVECKLLRIQSCMFIKKFSVPIVNVVFILLTRPLGNILVLVEEII